MKQRETSSRFLIEQPPTELASQEATVISAALPTSTTPSGCSVTSFELKYAQVHHDAGLYREWIARELGCYLVYGGMYGLYYRARRHCARLAKLSGLPLTEVIADVKADYLERWN